MGNIRYVQLLFYKIYYRVNISKSQAQKKLYFSSDFVYDSNRPMLLCTECIVADKLSVVRSRISVNRSTFEMLELAADNTDGEL